MDLTALLRMIQITDSLFPIGTYTLSNGLETFVAEGYIKTEQELSMYVKSYMELLAYGDVGVMMLSYSHADNPEYLTRLDSYANAMKAPMEVRQGSRKLCRRFLKLIDQVGEEVTNGFGWYKEAVFSQQLYGNYAQAVGLYSKWQQIPVTEAAGIYAFSLLSSVVTNAVKLVPLSQMSGQRILFQSDPWIRACVELAGSITMEDLGVSGVQFDVEAMRHEHLYTRLYIS